MEGDRTAASRLLSQLYLAEDGDLDKVRKRYVSRASKVAPERLETVRNMLEALVTAIQQDDPSLWEHVERAAGPLRRVLEPSQQAPASATAVSPLPKVSEPTEEPPPAPWASAPSVEAEIEAPAPRIEVAAPSPEIAVKPPSAPNMTVGVSSAPAARPLPFQGEAEKPASAVAPSQPNPASGATAAVSGGAPSSHLSAPVPFGSGEGVPSLTVQQYAQLWGRLDAEPDKKAEIYAKYNIADDAMRARLDAEWKTRLDADPTTMKLFVQLRQRIREQILES